MNPQVLGASSEGSTTKNALHHWNNLKLAVKFRKQGQQKLVSLPEELSQHFNAPKEVNQESKGLRDALQQVARAERMTVDQRGAHLVKNVNEAKIEAGRSVSTTPRFPTLLARNESGAENDGEQKDIDDDSVISDACSSITHGTNDFASHHCTFDMADMHDDSAVADPKADENHRTGCNRGADDKSDNDRRKVLRDRASSRRVRPEMPGRMASILYQAQASARTIKMRGDAKGTDNNMAAKACTIGHHAAKESRPFLAFELMNFAAEARRSSKRLMFQKGASQDNFVDPSSFSFRQCHILSMSPTTIIKAANDPWKLLDHGSRQMDTFIMETSAEVMYKYPAVRAEKKKNTLSPEVLSSFCFPYGVSVRLILRSALDGARNKGWVGPKADKYQLKAFTNESGDITHGICVSVRELFKGVGDADQEELIKCLQDRLRMRRAASRICALWRLRTRERIASRVAEERMQRLREQEERRMQLAKQGRSLLSGLLQSASKRITTSSRNVSSSWGLLVDEDSSECIISPSGDEDDSNRMSPLMSPTRNVEKLHGSETDVENLSVGGSLRRRSRELLGFDLSLSKHSRSDDVSLNGSKDSEEEPTPTGPPAKLVFSQRSASASSPVSSRGKRNSFGFSRRSFGINIAGVGGKTSSRSKSVGDWPSPERKGSQIDTFSDSALSSAAAVAAAELIDIDDDDKNVGGSSSLDGKDDCNEGGSVDDNMRTNQSLIMATVSECHEEDDGEKEYPEHVKKAAREAYTAMKESDTMGYVVIVKKCFVLTEVQDGQQALLFCALQQVINREREVRREEGYHVKLTSAEQERDSLFDYMQKHLRLTYKHSKIPGTTSKYDAVSSKKRYAFSFQLPGLNSMIVPLPLPNVTSEWGLGRFLMTIKQKSLMDLMRLLLLERSVLVIGKRPDQVTCCTSALLELLKPFKWAGAFIPFIRQDMLEFVTAPVPFIAGMTTETVKSIDYIKSDPFIQEAMKYGLSIVDLYRGELYITSCPAVRDVIESFESVPHIKLENYQKRIDELSQNDESTLHSFKSFVQRGFSSRERFTIHAIRDTIRENLETLMCLPSNDKSRWEAYGRIDPVSNEFDFDQESFMEPERLHMLSQVQFKEMATKTQIFLGYVEEQCRTARRQKELLRGMEAMVVAHWLGRHWKLYKERKAMAQDEDEELIIL